MPGRFSLRDSNRDRPGKPQDALTPARRRKERVCQPAPRKPPLRWRNGFGRAVSRFLSARIAPGRESFVLAASTRNPFRLRRNWSGPLRGSLFGLAPDGVFRAASLALRAVRSYRTVSPLPRPRCRRRGGLFSVALSVGMPRGIRARVYLRPNRSYTASRPMEFGLSSPDSRRERFSALPKPVRPYAITFFRSSCEFPAVETAVGPAKNTPAR